MSKLTYNEIDDDVLRATGKPPLTYFLALLVLGGGILMAAGLWLYQVKFGMGAANIHQPIDWGVYIANFVFWVGIAHSGTLISAILFLVRARWRDSVSRATEAMTIFAIMTAGLFPLVHMGRLWVIYYILPYPSQRQLWPNFISPLVWDVLAVSTYFTVSMIFFFIGLIPDLASFRDRCEATLGRDHWKTRLYRLLSAGWSGAGGQWRHYGRSYLYFSALATPLVISVHSIVSWDFAMSQLPGWHTTLFAPYFVAGAIHSGLALALVLLIPMRRFLKLEAIISIDHLEAVAKTILVTTAIIAYSYAIEPFMAWYGGNRTEVQYMQYLAAGTLAPVYWSLYFFNILAPLAFAFRALRRSTGALFAIGILVNVGMWLERVMIVTSATGHDFMPHNWSFYLPNLLETGITLGSFCFFFFLYLLFAKLLPAVPTTDLKSDIGERETEHVVVEEAAVPRQDGVGEGDQPGIVGKYSNPAALIEAAKQVKAAGFHRLDFFSPVRLSRLERLLGYGKSPVRFWTLAGALTGLIGGFSLAIGTALVNGLIVGGKYPVSIIPYCIVGFEGMILLGSLANFMGFLFYSRPYHHTRLRYDPRYSRNLFGLEVAAPPNELERLRQVMAGTKPDEMSSIT
jgi:molybdopterin-containing oxidoreductase family membrane subunit